VIVNPLSAINWNSASTTFFGGHYNLTLTRALDLNNPTADLSRNFQVDTTQGVVTLSGTISNTASVHFIKSGRGTLVLSGSNTQVATNTGNTNYGRSLFIDAGMLSVGADANFGRTTPMAAAQAHVANLPGDVLLRGGVLRVTNSFATTRQFQITTASGIDVTAGNTFTINPLAGGTTTASLSGAFAITKTGAGELAFNPLTTGTLSNTNNSLTIGGAPLITAANQTSGVSGGTVSTTATGGSAFGTGAVNLNGGVIALNGGTAPQAVTVTALNFGGGSYVQLSGSVSTSTLTATALTRSNLGTLTLLTSNTANFGTLGAGSLRVTTSSALATANGMLVTPNIYVRLLGAAQDATFASLSGGVLISNTANTTAGLSLPAPNELVDLSAPTTVASGTVDVLAVRTSADIVPGDATSLLRINTGGLIFNGATAPVLSANVYFGTPGVPKEALIYVRDGQTGTSTLSGSFTATNFAKSGPGTLLLSGTSNVLALTTTTMGALQINEGSVRFAGQASVPNGGILNIAPMDPARSISPDRTSLSRHSAETPATAATGNVLNSGAAATLTIAPQQGVTSIFNGLVSGNTALRFAGVGSLTLGYNNTYTGGTTIGAGNITSANGVYTPLGTLTVNQYNGLGNGPVTLCGRQPPSTLLTREPRWWPTSWCCCTAPATATM
jgi:autotransporter-associated beta strand protein